MRLLLLSLFALLTWTATAKDITNTKSAGFTLVLKEDLRFGGEEAEEDAYLWTDLGTKIIPGRDGQMFIVDIANSQVLRFDKAGKFLDVATGKGNGPGELRLVVSVCQSAQGTIYIMDLDVGAMGGAPRIVRFKNDMRYLDTIESFNFGASPALVTASPDDRYLAGIFAKIDLSVPTNNLITGIFDLQERKMIKQLYSFEVGFPDLSRGGDPSMWEDYLARQFKVLYNFGMAAWSPSGKVYTGISSDYRISRWTPGKAEADLHFERTYKAKTFGEEEQAMMLDQMWENTPPQARQILTKQVMQRAMKKAELPPRKAPLTALIPLEDKGIIAVHDVDVETRDNHADIFDPDGKWLGSFTAKDYGLFAIIGNNPTPRMIFKNGYAYTIETTEDSENVAVRYRYELKRD